MSEKRGVTARGFSIEEKLALWAPSLGPDLRKLIWEAHHEIVRLRSLADQRNLSALPSETDSELIDAASDASVRRSGSALPLISVEHINPAARYWIRRSWTRLWWVAINPDEALATVDSHTHYRAWTKGRLLAKLRRMNEPKDDPWEEVSARDLFA